MIKIYKLGETIVVDNSGMCAYYPADSVCTHAEGDSVEIKLKATRRTILSFNYKEMQPAQASAIDGAKYIANLV